MAEVIRLYEENGIKSSDMLKFHRRRKVDLIKAINDFSSILDDADDEERGAFQRIIDDWNAQLEFSNKTIRELSA